VIVDGNRAADRAIELVLGYYAAFNRGDWDEMLSFVSDDVAGKSAARPSPPSCSA
jgi:ketosteroid isomerase-like protein